MLMALTAALEFCLEMAMERFSRQKPILPPELRSMPQSRISMVIIRWMLSL